jgi:hypothetical protein
MEEIKNPCSLACRAIDYKGGVVDHVFNGKPLDNTIPEGTFCDCGNVVTGRNIVTSTEEALKKIG